MAWMYWLYSPAGVAFYALLFALIADKKTFRRLGESENGPFWQLMAGAHTGLIGLFGVLGLLGAFTERVHPTPHLYDWIYLMVVVSLSMKTLVILNLIDPRPWPWAPSDHTPPRAN